MTDLIDEAATRKIENCEVEASVHPVSPDDLIRRLQARLLSLADAPDLLSAAEIERMAKAITQLITSIERAEGFLRDRTGVAQPGDRLEGEARQEFLKKLKRLVESGILDELDD